MNEQEATGTIEDYFKSRDEDEDVTNPFDPKKDYLAELSSNEKWEENGKVYPYLKGLKRLAHEHRGGIRAIRSVPVKVPSVNLTGAKSEVPDCIAACTVTYVFNDGTSFSGSADASYKAHKAPFNLHLLALAESKAEARAIRRAFNISQCAKEEIGGGDDDDNRDNEPINDTQLEGLKRNARRKKLSQNDVLKLIKREDLGDIKKLTQAEAIKALKAVNRFKPKEVKVEEAPKETVDASAD